MVGGLVTIESLMFFGIGLLLAMLVSLAMMTAVHRRAVRLTRRKYDVTPLSMRDIQTERDGLRAKFAMATRDLETNIDGLREKSAIHAVDAARKSETIAHLKSVLQERIAAFDELALSEQALQAREAGLFAQLHDVRNDNNAKAEALSTAGLQIARMNSEINELRAALDERSHLLAVTQGEQTRLRQENTALQSQVTSLIRNLRQQAEWQRAQELNGEARIAEVRPRAVAVQQPLAASPKGLAVPAAPVSISDALHALHEEREGIHRPH